MTAHAMAELIKKAPPGPWHGDWAKWDCTRDAFLLLLQECIDNMRPYPEEKYKGKGIVVSVNAKPGMSSGKHLHNGYLPGAWVLVKELRRLGCTLPVTFTYMGALEWDPKLTQLMKPLGVDVIDLREVEETDPYRPRILAGWESKCYGIIHSPYEQVMYLDADNIPQYDPSFLFDSQQFTYYGAIFWPDVPPYDRKEWLPECVWKNVGLEFRDEVDFETGQFMIDKKKCWKELLLAMWMNEHSDYFYRFIFGDKSTFHLAWARMGSNWAIPQRGPGGNQGSLFQHDFEGRILFQHCTRNKPNLGGYPSNGHLLHPSMYESHLEDLRGKWNGKLWVNDNPTDAEQAMISDLTGKSFKYTRKDLGERIIRLLEDSRIGKGLARMEVSWNLFIQGDQPIIVIASLEDCPTAVLKYHSDGSWHGRWLEHERCECSLEPI
jgi:hypothetical protein